jgi:hypothetical protein
MHKGGHSTPYLSQTRTPEYMWETVGETAMPRHEIRVNQPPHRHRHRPVGVSAGAGTLIATHATYCHGMQERRKEEKPTINVSRSV